LVAAGENTNTKRQEHGGKRAIPTVRTENTRFSVGGGGGRITGLGTEKSDRLIPKMGHLQNPRRSVFVVK